jgi:myo-inositol-1(or 4)-monophosphatase
MTPIDLEALRSTAVFAVEAGMEVVARSRVRRKDVESAVGGSQADQYAAYVDSAAEQAVAGVLGRADPRIPVVGDLPGGVGHVERAWIVDPVDGTTNLVRGDSFVGVTVAMLVDGQPVVGATGCPFTGELWSAAIGLGAYDGSGSRLDLEEPTSGPPRVLLDPAASDPEHLATWDAVRRRVHRRFGNVELRSAIALELALVAAGVFHGLVQVGGSPVQDFAAGVLLVREAGGLITGLDGREDVWLADIVVGGTPITHHALREALQEFGTTSGAPLEPYRPR